MSGISSLHGPHHVAQKFTSRYFPVGFLRSALRPSSETVSTVTGLAFHAASCFWTLPILVSLFHLVEQPKTAVWFTAGCLPASSASIASRVSCVLAFASI